MGLDRPIKLSLIFAFASVSIAAIRLVAHLPFVVNTWHCFQLVPSASVLRPVLVQQICHVLPGNLRPVRINSKTSRTSSPSQPTCRESSPGGLGSLISNLNRNVHT